jgi:Uma2 family endonuclease
LGSAAELFPKAPEPEDVLLLIEVADTSLAEDRSEKRELYAAASIADYWIVNLIDQSIEVYRQPLENSYQSTSVYLPGEIVTPLALPTVSFPVSNLFAG